MKLAKLSLAAIVAVGAMSTFASASPLEEAIKGVELNGYLRYRFTSNDKAKGHTDEHRFTGVTDFTIPVAENLKAGMMLTVDGTDDAANGKASDHSDKLDLDLDRIWFQYAVDGFSVKGGKIEIFSPWTDPAYRGSVGDGAIALYSGVPGWTFGAAAFVSTNLAPGFLDGLAQDPQGPYSFDKTTGEIVPTKAGVDAPNIGQENLYAAGALGSVGPVNVQLWGASMTNVFDYSIFAEAGFEMAGFNLRAQINNLKLAKETKPLFTDDSGIYWGVEAGFEMAGFSVGVGYTQNDKDQPIYTLADDDSSGFIFSGAKQINGDVVNIADMQTYFIDLGYTMGAYGVGAGYAHGDVKAYDLDEWYVQASYAYAKNFQLSTYFSSYEQDNKNAADEENDRIRFEAKYSF